jgi:hypothetical protein
LDVTFCILFAIEMIVKHIALGVFFGKKAYWRQGWNVLDGIVVITSVYDLLTDETQGLVKISSLRIVRGLRPLRVISRNPNLKLVVNTLLVSVPALCNLVVVGTLFFLIFGLLAVSYLKGSFFTCFVPGSLESLAIPSTAVDVMPLCIEEGGFTVAIDGSCQSGVFWQRPSPDTPICLGYCDPYGEDPLPAGCPGRLKVDDLPSFCHGAETWESGEPSAAWVMQQKKMPMPCTFTGPSSRRMQTANHEIIAKSDQGCYERFCADIQGENQDFMQCEKECAVHPYICAQSCTI